MSVLPRKFATVAAKLDFYVDKISSPRGCWLWTGAKTFYGYGNASVKGHKNVMAHRASWKRHRGPIPKGKCICHHCDVRLCINPDHLFVGTKRQNNEDRDLKGRAAKPETMSRGRIRSGTSKLNEEKVRSILTDNRHRQLIADEHDISIGMVYRIKRRDARGYAWVK